MSVVEITLIKEVEKVIDLLKSELAAQGHRNTGSLERSITYSVKRTYEGLLATVSANEYAIYLEFGVPASRIPYTPGSGAKSSKYIAGLINYFKSKGLQPSEARSAAFATARAHKREGMPTRSSYRFSSNNRRTYFTRTTVEQYLPTLVDNLQKAGAQEVQTLIAGQLFAINSRII